MRTINISKEFSRTPIGGKSGPYSGRKFREEILTPALKENNGVVEVDFKGCSGMSWVFLEEAFGGLVRRDGYTPQELKKKLRFAKAPDYRIFIKLAKDLIEKADTVDA